MWPSYTIWRPRSGSTLAQIMAWCLAAPLPEPMLTIHQSARWQLRENHFTRTADEMNPPDNTCTYICLEINLLKFHRHFPWVNSLRPRQNRRHFADDVFKCNFLIKNVWTPIKISLNFVPKGPINNIPALVQIMAWRRPGEKPLSEPMMVRLPTHIWVTRPQWVKA